MVVVGLGRLGAILEEAANARGDLLISRPASRIALYVMPTSEETMIARNTLDTICPLEANQGGPPSPRSRNIR